MEKIYLLDSTLRDGAQGEGISFSVEDKLGIAAKLDKLGIQYIEAGNPFSNPKDMLFFQRARQLGLENARLVAFGSTRRHSTSIQDDAGCRSLLAAETEAVAIFGKTWGLHVTEVLRTTLAENLAMITDTIAFFKQAGREVLFDAEHFFDGFAANPAYALDCLGAACRAGADCLVLCDTNGGCLPEQIQAATAAVLQAFPGKTIGIHCHNDAGCAVASSLAAVQAGARHMQGTYIGFGERCGNANLSTLIANLQLKLGYDCIPPQALQRLTKTANYIAEVTNLRLPATMPYVGKSAFAHKGGMHVDGVAKNSRSFEHIHPETVGNSRNILLSEVSGRTAVARRMRQVDASITRESSTTAAFTEKLKQREQEGYLYETAEASLELFVRKHLGRYQPAFALEYFKLICEQPAPMPEGSATAVVKVRVGQQLEMTSGEGQGPVHALDVALRRALEVFYPSLSSVRLIDYKVRVMDSTAATAARVRVMIESTDGQHIWTTVGVSADIIDASWQALRDSIEYKLLALENESSE